MDKTHYDAARTALISIADAGHVVFAFSDEGTALVVDSSFENAPQLAKEISQKDPLGKWMFSAIGTSDLSEIGKTSQFLQNLGLSGHPFGLAGLLNRTKVAAVVVRSGTNLKEETASEAFAAAYVLADNKPTPRPIEPSPKVAAYLSKIIEGRDDQQIADDLDLSLRAIKERKKKTIEEFEANTLTEAVAISVKNN